MRQHCVAYLDCTWILIQLVGHSTFNDEQRRLSVYAAMFLPLRKTMYKDRKAKDVPVVNYIFRDSLKQGVSNAETVINLHNALEKFLSLLPHFVPNGDVKLAEVDMGREYVDVPLTSKESNLRVLTDFWRVALLMSTLLYPTNVLNKNLKPEDRRALLVEAERSINNLGDEAAEASFKASKTELKALKAYALEKKKNDVVLVFWNRMGLKVATEGAWTLYSRFQPSLFQKVPNSIPNPEFELGARFRRSSQFEGVGARFAAGHFKVLEFDSQQAI